VRVFSIIEKTLKLGNVYQHFIIFYTDIITAEENPRKLRTTENTI
jgi:hypothetical protein